MTVWQLRIPIEDGMKVIVTATPKLTNWGKFSLTVRSVRPSGEGSLKKSFEILKAKLEAEGLFAAERKRSLPHLPKHIAIVSSTQAAGYGDFIKILDDRFGGMKVEVAHVQVQGEAAPDQMIRALKHFNEQEMLAEVIVLIRGGGSADDLSAFNDEPLVREIAASRIPVLTGIGHEIDISLADMAADVRAATPSNAAQLLVPDRRELVQQVHHMVASILPRVERAVEDETQETIRLIDAAWTMLELQFASRDQEAKSLARMVAQFNPQTILERGYSLVRGKIMIGSVLEIEQAKQIITAEVQDVRKK